MSYDGTVHVEGDLDLADAYDLNTAVAAGASELAALGSTRVRWMCAAPRRWVTWPAPSSPSGSKSPEGTPKPRVPRRQVVLHAHIAAAAVTGCTPAPAGAADLARVQEVLAAITTEQVRQWCGNADTQVTVKPVLDLAEHIWVMSYEASDRLKDQTAAA